MKLKNTDKNYWQRVPDQHYSKNYLIRKIEEQEAEDEIDEFEHEPQEFPMNNNNVGNVNE